MRHFVARVSQLRKTAILPVKNPRRVSRRKTKASTRRRPFSGSAKAIFKARLNRFDDSFLFHQNDKDGSPPSKASDSFHLWEVGKFGFKSRLSDCRHTFATIALEIRICRSFRDTRIRPKPEKLRRRSPDAKTCEKAFRTRKMKTTAAFVRYGNCFQSRL